MSSSGDAGGVKEEAKRSMSSMNFVLGMPNEHHLFVVVTMVRLIYIIECKKCVRAFAVSISLFCIVGCIQAVPSTQQFNNMDINTLRAKLLLPLSFFPSVIDSSEMFATGASSSWLVLLPAAALATSVDDMVGSIGRA